MPERSEFVINETTVKHTAWPAGNLRNGDNGPHLSDLREFVEACEGLPDDLKVFIDNGALSESGRRNVTFRVTLRIVDPAEPSGPES